MGSVLKKLYGCYHRCLTALYRLYLRAAGVGCGEKLKLFGFPVIWPCRRGQIVIGSRVVMRSSPLSNAVGLNHRCILRTIAPEARIIVGDGVSMSGATLLARAGITLGRGVMIGANCTIVDSDLHPLEVEDRLALDPAGIRSAEVIIEEGVFLGMGVMVLKGVRIGRNTIVGAGAVVAASLPPDSVAAGNPARVVKTL